MRVEDGELVAVVLEEPQLGVDVELEAKRRLEPVSPALVADGLPIAEDDQPAGLVRRLLPCMRLERVAHGGGDHHQTLASIASSSSDSGSCQKSAER